ncbi:nitrogen permease regulator 2 [Venturia nashicola]|uniref:Nitrogen permease regulator 2 n=1 Tax=Venturia nashicola TaxID=86259 RepID=A0A4Z1PAT1_9PEZI|nr:nitrogen permease regulator 2 [Venturia nashicola]
MIKAIFFTRFHPEKGSSVLHQVPEGAIVPPPHPQPHLEKPLFDFAAVSEILIPRQEFCDRPVTLCVNRARIIGHPVCIDNARYERRQYIFNLAMVLDEEADFSGHLSVVKKLASIFRNLEEQSLFLSMEERELFWVGGGPVLEDGGEVDGLALVDDGDGEMKGKVEDVETGEKVEYAVSDEGQLTASGLLKKDEAILGGKVYALCEMIMEDLNNYCECMIPIDDINTINLKLFPARPSPAPIHPWHVPFATVHLPSIARSSDLTLSKIIPYINGVLSIAQIATLADTDLSLTRKAIQHLLFYGCVLILDIFQFGAIYAPTAEIGSFVEDADQISEAVRYVCMGTYRRLHATETTQHTREEWAWKSAEVCIDRARLVQLYTSLKQGVTLATWCSQHDILLQGIDVRRFITFGIIKGFLYRVHKYIIAPSASLVGTEADTRNDVFHQALNEGDVNGYGRDGNEPWSSRRASTQTQTDLAHREAQMAKYLDGTHCVDEMCTEMQSSEKLVLEKIKKSFLDMQIIQR